MTNKYGECSIWEGNIGPRVLLHLGSIDFSLDEVTARRILANLDAAIEKAWPSQIVWAQIPTTDGVERYTAEMKRYTLCASNKGDWHVMFDGHVDTSGGTTAGLADAKACAEARYRRMTCPIDELAWSFDPSAGGGRMRAFWDDRAVGGNHWDLRAYPDGEWHVFRNDRYTPAWCTGKAPDQQAAMSAAATACYAAARGQ